MIPEEIAVPPLVLRRWRMAEAPALLAAMQRSLPELRQFMPWATTEPTVESVEAFLVESWTTTPPETLTFGLFDAAGEIVGGSGLHGRRGPGILEIGYWVRSDRTGRGYATAAAGALTVAALEHFPAVHRVEIRCDPVNGASAAIAAKLGYRLDAVIDVEVEADAETGVQQIWVADRSTWRPSAGRPARPAGRTRR